MTWRLLVVATIVGLLTACGGSGESDSGVATLESGDSTDVVDTTAGDGPDEEEVDAEQAMLDFAECMRENGVDIEDPTVDADGNLEFGDLRPEPGQEEPAFDREAMREAMNLCREEIDSVALGFGGRGEIDITEMQDTLVEYAACMRENGYEMDDPDFSQGGPGQGEPGDGESRGPFGGIDADDPDFAAAQEACQYILGDTFLPRTGGPPPGGSSIGGASDQ